MTFPTPTGAQILAAFRAHGLRFVVEDVVADAPGREWSNGIRAIVDHHTAGRDSLRLLLNAGGRYPTVNALVDRDGLVHVLTTKSVWGSGAGGPWPGVAAKDSLHLVAWQNEVEDLGQGRTFTPEQLESLGRMNAALVSLGVPAGNEVNHRDWTDGNDPIPGPLPTRGRKVDTRYSGDELRANTRRYRLPTRHLPIVRSKRLGLGKRSADVLRMQKALSRYVGLDYSSGVSDDGRTGVWGPRTQLAYYRAVRKSGGRRGLALYRYLGRLYGFEVV